MMIRSILRTAAVTYFSFIIGACSKEKESPIVTSQGSGSGESTCSFVPSQIQDMFNCGRKTPFDDRFKKTNEQVIHGRIPFESAVQPYTPYTPQQMCNRLWRNFDS